MNRIRRAFAAALLAGLGTAAALYGDAQGRVLGAVRDPQGNPIPGAVATITSPEFKFNLQKTADEKGNFTVIVLDATRSYVIRVEKEGYIPTQGPLDVHIGENTPQTYTMVKGTPGGQPKEGKPAPPKELSGADKAIPVFNDGVTAFKAGDAATAIAKFQEAEQLDPKQAAAPGALADVYLSQKQYPQAVAEADKYLAIKPGDPRGLRDRYDAYEGMGDKAKAKEALDALAAADPSRDTAIRVYNLGAAASRAGQNVEAAADLKKAIEIDPKMEPAYSGLANVYYNQKNYPEALATVDQLLALNPASAEAFRIRADVYRRMAADAATHGEKSKAAELTKKSQEAAQQGKASLGAAAKTGGGSPDAVFNQGVAQFNSNDIQAATQTFEKVLEMKPAHARAHYMLGLCYVNQGNSAKAREYLSKFIQLAPSDPDAKTAKEMLQSL